MNCLFYAAVFPEGVIITLIGLIITYWLSKWWLVKFCCIPKLSFRMGKMIVKIVLFRIT
jgi:hypothetical protein